MSYLPESPEWTEGVYQLERNDPVSGGPLTVDASGKEKGTANKPLIDLAKRTRWLYKQFNESFDGLGWLQVGTWAVGLEISLPKQIVNYSGSWYRYRGDLSSPHIIVGNSPTTDGGIWSSSNPDGLWVDIGDASLRIELSSDGDGQGASMVSTREDGTVQEFIDDIKVKVEEVNDATQDALAGALESVGEYRDQAENAALAAVSARDAAQSAVSVDFNVATIAERDALTAMASQTAYVRETALFYTYDGTEWGGGFEGFLAGVASTDSLTLLESEIKQPWLNGMVQSQSDEIIPLAGIRDGEGNIRAVFWYDPSDADAKINGQQIQTARELGWVFAGMAQSQGLEIIPLAGIRDGAGNIRATVWYEPESAELIVNGRPAGQSGSGLVYAHPEKLPDNQIPEFANVMHLLTYGQSLSKGFNSTPPHSTSQPYNNLSFSSGPRSTLDGSVGNLGGMDALAPLIENTLNGDGIDSPQCGESPCSAWANGLTRRLARDGEDWRTSARQFLSSASGRGSASITNLLPGGSTAMGEWWQVFVDGVTQGHALSIAAGKTYGLPVWVYMQGERDNPDSAMSGGVWKAHMSAMHDAVASLYASVTGRDYTPWLGIYQTYGYTRRERPHATIDQIEVAEEMNSAFHLTALYHLDIASDGHLTALGSYWAGEYMAKKTRQLLSGYRPQWMRIGGATITGRIVRYRPREIPVAPLRLRIDEHLRETTDYGFLVRDDAGTCTISDIAIGSRGDEVVITLESEPAGDVILRYGLDYLPAGQIDYHDSAGGNLVDSDPETFFYDNAEYPLYNVCPHFQINVIPV